MFGALSSGFSSALGSLKGLVGSSGSSGGGSGLQKYAALGLDYWGARRNLAEARANREFQRHMYQNRYQYTVRDMKAAGLNPMLAATQGVGGGMPQGAMPANMIGLGSNFAKADLASSSARQADQQSRLTGANAAKAEVMTAMYDAMLPLVKELKGMAPQSLSGVQDIFRHLQGEFDRIMKDPAVKDAVKDLEGIIGDTKEAYREIRQIFRDTVDFFGYDSNSARTSQ